ncbi:MAG: glycosyltransferase family 39 protein [Candidatus Marsarchaeota archaeon]|nr:glycosyltransferase family 39 protein [Candidatus Marsarchaeota archaeon]
MTDKIHPSSIKLHKKILKPQNKEFAWIKHHYTQLIIIAIIVYAIIYSVLVSIGPAKTGDDMAYAGLAIQTIHGAFHETNYIYTVRFLQVFPIAFFYEILGVNGFSSAAWDITSFVLSVIIAYFLGKELYNKKVGLIAALLMCFFPLVLQYTGTMSDDTPVMMFVSLTILALLYARKRNSKKWYFASGALVISAPLVTPLGFIIIPFLAGYLAIELLRRKLSINRITLYFVVGLLFSGILLMIINYILSGNPLITITLNGYYYSQVGTPGFATAGALAGPLYYVHVIFPYNLSSLLYNAAMGKNVSVSNLFENNVAGFFFYAFIICTAYLIAKRERRAYLPLLWFTIMFVYLSVGPEYITLKPFYYLLMIRLNRYLLPIAIPVVIIISMGVARFIEDEKRQKRKIIRIIFSSLAIIFIITMSIPLNLFWYHTKIVTEYDMQQIGYYISNLPNTTKIFYLNGLSEVIVFSGAQNPNRFYAYDQISNCSALPTGAYVVVPKYVEYYNLAYTPNPSNYCPGWKLVLYPRLDENFSTAVTGQGIVFRAKLYYIEQNNSK